MHPERRGSDLALWSKGRGLNRSISACELIAREIVLLWLKVAWIEDD